MKNSILVDCDDINGWVNSIKKLHDINIRQSIANQALADFHKYSWKNKLSLLFK